MLYTIEDKTLTAMGDAIRNKILGQIDPPVITGERGIDYGTAEPFQFNSTVRKVKIIGHVEWNYNGGSKHTLAISRGYYTSGYDAYSANAKVKTFSNIEPYDFEIELDGNTFTFHTNVYSNGPALIKLNYTAIGLDENGNEFKYTPLEMVEAINGLDTIPSFVLNITGNGQYRFAYNANNWLIEQFGNKITTNNIYDAVGMFLKSDKLTEIPFEINLDNNAKMEDMFKNCEVLTTIPQVNITRTTHGSYSSLFNYCGCMREIPEWCVDLLEQDYNVGGSNSVFGPWSSMFANCYSLREIPERAIRAMWSQNPSGNYYTLAYSKPFGGCFALDRLVGLCCDDYAFTSNQFNSFFQYLYHIEDFTFATQEDGSPYVRGWKSQTLDLSSYIGFYNAAHQATNYASGLTTTTQITDDATYQALKDNPDSWTTNINYSRYNHDSAVRTIMSLPDCSAKGGNTIKFKGAAGAKTDGGAINTLTEEEIAVATAKGWTVSLV